MFFLNVGLRENIFRTKELFSRGVDNRQKTAQRGTFEGHSRINKNRRALSCSINRTKYFLLRENFSPPRRSEISSSLIATVDAGC